MEITKFIEDKLHYLFIHAFELWCWRRFLRVPWGSRRSNRSILKEISPEYSLERLMLKLQYFGHLMWRTDSLEKTLMLGKTKGRKRSRWDGWMASPTRWTWVWVSSRNWWWTGRPGMLQSMGSQRVGHDWATKLNRTESHDTEYFVLWKFSHAPPSTSGPDNHWSASCHSGLVWTF